MPSRTGRQVTELTPANDPRRRGNPSIWEAASCARRERPNLFTPAAKCANCVDGATFLVPPSHWPVDTVARVCYACGRVQEYVDNLLLFTPREAVIEFQPRPWAVRRGVAIEPAGGLVPRDLIVSELESGCTVSQIAAFLRVDRHYVLNVARAAGYG